MQESIQFGSKQILFTLEFVPRKTLGITVTPDMKVLVKAPLGAEFEKVKDKIRSKAAWILKQQSFFLSFHPKTPPKKFVNGETHLYLGRQYRLKIVEGAQKSVKLKGGFIEVIVPKKADAKTLIEAWYYENAAAKFLQYAAPLIAKFSKYNVQPSKVLLRDMPGRWGSCTSKGKIILNPELIKAPKGCIEYVIIHELCHLIHRDHTKKFIELQTKEMPTWEKWKMKLETLLA